jgi:bifunctional N-acetylglucosamine-1-phosphate-uridyltransferase/glucosamine-1-phosphate-acetyltransferase GlmU-like protein
MTICAVIPAAGRGTRLGSGAPKVLTAISEAETIWSTLYATIAPVVDHIHLVLSPAGRLVFDAAYPSGFEKLSCSLQLAPLGMGDAIFGAIDAWRSATAVLIVWGDQVLIARDTLARAIAALGGRPRSAIVPVTRVDAPYVEYLFDRSGRLEAVRQTREGDVCSPTGDADVGTFLISVEGLEDAWKRYLETAPRGASTGEVNFLPFLPFLARQGWNVEAIEVADNAEARGVNTPDDLAFVRAALEARRSSGNHA